LPRDGAGHGAGFAAGGALDALAPGPGLAGFTDDAHARLAGLDDDALIGVLRGWRRLAAWAQARELATITELARRRPAGGAPPAPPGQLPAQMSEFVADEIAFALTLTGHAAGTQLKLALDLAARPAVAAALEAGRIDLRRAMLILSMVCPLSAGHADAVEAQILPGAGDLTTGQLCAALRRAVLAVDPQAARRRREEAEKSARVEHWGDPEGTATLTGRYLPPAEVLAADKRLCQIAAGWRNQGAAGGMDLLRARACLALLLGLPIDAPPADLLPPAIPPASSDPAPDLTPGSTIPRPDRTTRGADSTGPGPGPAAPGPSGEAPGSTVPDAGTAAPGLSEKTTGRTGPGAGGRPRAAEAGAAGGPGLPDGLRRPGTGTGLPPLAGLVNLTVPLTTLLGLAEAPGQAAGHGPIDADTARVLACAVAGHRATRWQITVTAPDGTALAHGTASRLPGKGSPGPGGSGPGGTRPGGGGPGSGGPGSGGPGSGGPGGGGPGSGWSVAVTAEPLATGSCDHRQCEPGYRPSPALQRLIRARASTCTAPGCRRPAAICDLDHTRAYDEDGWTCECNLAPLCRRHHRLKQAQGWQLHQPSPGVMTWRTPAGRRHTILPSQHPT
jgi:hypothetical protein